MTVVNLGESFGQADDEVGMLRLAIGEQGLSDKYLKCDGSIYSLLSFPDFLMGVGLTKISASKISPTLPETANSNNNFYMAYGNGTYVITRSPPLGGSGNSNAEIYASTDLINWTKTIVSVPASTVDRGLSIQFINNKFLAFRDDSKPIVFSSTDGIAWTRSIDSNGLKLGTAYTHRIGFFKNRYYVSNYYSAGLQVSSTSDPLGSWTALAVAGNTSNGITNMDSNVNCMCAVNYRGTAIHRTTDGINFTIQYGVDSAVGSGLSSDILYIPWARGGAGRWLASLGGLNQVMYSDDDGITWSDVPNAPAGSFSYDDQKNIAISPKGSKGGIYISQDEGMNFFGDLNGGGSIASGKNILSNGTNFIAISYQSSKKVELNLYDPVVPFNLERTLPTLKDANGTFYHVRAKK